ncbi:hypothetical protein JD844_001045 [Phrynosoma platyrhinos]|uniref:Receptor ligand binding region domain-containing protein n=1 Tax=Phrynosoma platyrhinos TaxID=52577 RepID=A0ABQ7T976_PHRPL|nr:hypothetical protein JD844_001045 [Phrynosoma platyrhinos]
MKEINQNAHLLPNATLGQRWTHKANNEMGTCSGTMDLLFTGDGNPPNYICKRKYKLMAVIGGLSSHNSKQMPHILNIYKMAQLSFGSFDPALNDKVQFPSVYRMIPNEMAQYVGIVKLLKHFGWTWIGLIVSEDDTTLMGSSQFQFFSAVQKGEKSRKFNSGCDWKTKVENISIEVQEAIVIGEFVSFFVPEHEVFSFNILPAKRGKAFTLPKFCHQYFAFQFAMKEINQNAHLLPNATLDQRWTHKANNEMGTCSGTMNLLFTRDGNPPNYNCNRKYKLMAVIGGLSSHNSRQMPHILNIYKMAQLSFGSFDPALKDKVQFPSVYRMIPNERAQYVGIVKLLKHFGWTWIGLIVSEDDSGEALLRTLVPWLLQNSICFAFKEIIPIVKENWMTSLDETWEVHDKMARMQFILSSTDTNVILVHGDSQSMEVLQLILMVNEFFEMKPTEKVWIITAQWDFTAMFLSGLFTLKSFNGTLSFALPTKKIEGYAQYLSTINPTGNHDYVAAVLWTSAFLCSFPQYDFYVNNATNCTGEEKLSSLPESVFGMGMSGQSYSIYNAAYAIAHALHAMLSSRSKHKGGRDGGTWNLQNMHPWQVQVLHSFLKHIHFNNSAGDEIFFDENGELETGYDILNTVTFHNRSMHSSHVGWSDPRAPEGKDFLIHQNSILWNHKFIQV